MSIHETEWGTIFRYQLLEDGQPLVLTDASEIKIRFLRKSGNVLEVSAVIEDPAQAIIAYTFQQGELTPKGTWKAQPHVHFPNGLWYGDIVTFEVKEIIPAPTVPAP